MLKTFTVTAIIATLFAGVFGFVTTAHAQGISPAHIKVIATGAKVLVKFKVLNMNDYPQQYKLSVDGVLMGTLAPMKGKSKKNVRITLKSKKDAVSIRRICITPRKSKYTKVIIPVCVKATITDAGYIRKGKEQ